MEHTDNRRVGTALELANTHVKFALYARMGTSYVFDSGGRREAALLSPYDHFSVLFWATGCEDNVH